MEMIIYRHYKPGDDEQLAILFNKAFQMNGGGVIKTSKSWNWRYAQSPEFEPEMCQIAEDVKNNNTIVGAVYVNLVEKVYLEGKQYLTGDINDVATHPDYTHNGISKKLMQMAIEYMKKKNCDISLLSADYNGFARKKIYWNFGYSDLRRELLCIQFPNIFKLVKDLPFSALFFPVIFTLSYIPRFLNRLRIKFECFFKDVSYEINYNKNHFEYMRAVNRIVQKYYNGFRLYDNEKIKWARIKVPAIRQKPTYIIVKKGKKIVGGAVITYQNLYSSKYGVKIRLGMIHEIFLDKIEFNNKRNLHLGYIYLIDKILKAATRRFIGVLIYKCDITDNDLLKGFNSMNFLKFKGEILMIKVLKKHVKIPQFIKPFFLPTSLTLSVP